MPEYRRLLRPGGTFFLTPVTYQRRPLFLDRENVRRLRTAIESIRSTFPFLFVAGVVLPDHAHFLWTLPPDDSDYSARIGRVKAAFTRSLPTEARSNPAPRPLPRQTPRGRRLAAPVLGAHDQGSRRPPPAPRFH